MHCHLLIITNYNVKKECDIKSPHYHITSLQHHMMQKSVTYDKHHSDINEVNMKCIFQATKNKNISQSF